MPIILISRSTKLVIIERLLLLAERYVITIEVMPTSFTSLLVGYDWIKPQTKDLYSNLYSFDVKILIHLINNLNHIL